MGQDPENKPADDDEPEWPKLEVKPPYPEIGTDDVVYTPAPEFTGDDNVP